MMNYPKSTTSICKKCKQWCCRTEPHRLMPNTPKDVLEYYEQRAKLVVKEKDGSWTAYLAQPCQHVSNKGCKIYEDRPDVCKKFPAQWNQYQEPYCELMRLRWPD
jgi:Fe-S-cluster containining protein